MNEVARVEQAKIGNKLAIMICILLTPLGIYLCLGWADNSTELTPSHDNVLNACFAVGGVCGLIAGGFAVYLSKGLAVWRRIPITLCFCFEGFLSCFMLSSRVVDIVEMRMDFPPSNMEKVGIGIFRQHRFGPISTSLRAITNSW